METDSSWPGGVCLSGKATVLFVGILIDWPGSGGVRTFGAVVGS